MDCLGFVTHSCFATGWPSRRNILRGSSIQSCWSRQRSAPQNRGAIKRKGNRVHHCFL